MANGFKAVTLHSLGDHRYALVLLSMSQEI